MNTKGKKNHAESMMNHHEETAYGYLMPLLNDPQKEYVENILLPLNKSTKKELCEALLCYVVTGQKSKFESDLLTLAFSVLTEIGLWEDHDAPLYPIPTFKSLRP